MFRSKFTKKSKKIIQKFKNKKFNYKEYIKDFYIESGVAHVYANVTDYYDIISKYSIKNHETLNKEFAEYLEEVTYYIPIDYPVELEIMGASFTEEEKQKIEETIKEHFGLKLSDAEMELRENRRSSLSLLLVGVIMLFVLYILYETSITAVLLEAYLVVLWFFIWSYYEFEFVDRPKLKMKKLDIGQIASVKITFEH